MTVLQAGEKRDALAKFLYERVFLYLVWRVNGTIAADDGGAEVAGAIGLLDIYGFEHFEINSLEQLLINYANESLQRHFNQHLLHIEQEIYAQEGVDWSYISFNDNQPTLDLIEGGQGVLNLLDDAWGGLGMFFYHCVDLCALYV